MDTLPPVENAQFVSPVGSPSAAPAAQETSAPKFSKRSVVLVVGSLLLVVIVVAAIWLFSRQSSSPTSISQEFSDEFSQTAQPVQENPPPSTVGNIREDSPGFVGGRAEEGQTANADGCTLDTQTCSDGTLVERQGPSCEFATCPTASQTPARTGWTVYSNSQYKYSLSVPSDWRVTEDGATTAASGNSDLVLVFNPALPLGEDSFNGMTIEFSGPLMDTAALEQVTMNGVPMFRSAGQHGPTYFVNVPGTEDYLFITGADGDTPDEGNNQMLREIFATFRVL